jgi:hypothetical protein
VIATEEIISASGSIDTGCTIVRTMFSMSAKNSGSEWRAAAA